MNFNQIFSQLPKERQNIPYICCAYLAVEFYLSTHQNDTYKGTTMQLMKKYSSEETCIEDILLQYIKNMKTYSSAINFVSIDKFNRGENLDEFDHQLRNLCSESQNMESMDKTKEIVKTIMKMIYETMKDNVFMHIFAELIPKELIS